MSDGEQILERIERLYRDAGQLTDQLTGTLPSVYEQAGYKELRRKLLKWVQARTEFGLSDLRRHFYPLCNVRDPEYYTGLALDELQIEGVVLFQPFRLRDRWIVPHNRNEERKQKEKK